MKDNKTEQAPSMFEKLMDLPLFRGASRQKLSQLVGEIKFHFLKYPKGETIIRAGEPCTHLAFIISGSVRATIVNASGRFAVSQSLAAPSVIAPDFLFGKYTDYPCTVEALDTVGILKIAKSDYIRMLDSDTVFLFNFLNIISSNGQKALEGILSLTTGDIDERIAYWVGALTQPGAYDIVLSCRKRDLCSLFGMPRMAFDASLQAMKERSLLDYTPRELRIVDRAALLALLQHNPEHILA
ncbi:MAG: Crp/Fnr family transcriptional regulator [Muribaculaceae bacterium]|nr:Crp/Fnr family transcriptional regulator [Muribaculaceae bacterium]